MRESSLQAENLAYGKALEATQRHAQDKASEAERLTARLAGLEEGESPLETELQEARAAVSRAMQESTEGRERVASGGEAGTAEERGGEERELLERQKREAEEMDRMIEQLQEKLAQHEKVAAKWPSAGEGGLLCVVWNVGDFLFTSIFNALKTSF